jgi:uncharacterized protein (DUF1778 family)
MRRERERSTGPSAERKPYKRDFPRIASGEPARERASFEQPVLGRHLRDALARFDPCVQWTYVSAMASSNVVRTVERRVRGARLGFRVDATTKRLVERAARLERRKVTDFCLTALTDAARKTLERHESLSLSEADRAAFFDALVHPPKPNARLRRALRAEESRIGR